MSRKRCIRKHWHLVNPIEYAINGAHITSQEHLAKLRLVELSALEAFAKGHATQQDWRTVADILNIAETMARSGIGPEVLAACEAVQSALGEAHRRFKELGRLGVTGPEMQAMRDLYAYHDLQRTSITRSQYEAAIDQTRNRIRSAHPSHKTYI